MRFATARQLTIATVAWAAFLVAYDHHANPRPLAAYVADFKGSSTRPTVVSEGDTPRVRLSMPHLCCTGCLNDVTEALKPLTWLGSPRMVGDGKPLDEAAAATAKDGSTAHEVDLDVLDLKKADFVKLIDALQGVGLVPDRIEVSGMGHFRLDVELPHLCCGVCSRAVDEQLGRMLRKESQGRWLDSMTTDHTKKVVTIYARLNAVVDLLELTRALAQAGFAAKTIHIQTGPES